ncbi:hypothetical protein MMC07_005879 [Pseudocyphellaria aurata]|nr:hypothetical protein [Pseudocyphellaria aurata]
MTSQITRLTVLISGSGTNLEALITACRDDQLPNTHIVRVVSNRKAAYGLVRAQNAGIATRYHNLVEYKKRYPDSVNEAREEYDKDLARLVLEDEPHLVVCAGWMHILSPQFLEPLEAAKIPVINLHPALPGAYNGANAIERAHQDWIDGQITTTGIMIHKVISEVDMGSPILVQEIPFEKGVDEDIEALKERIHKNEWKLIVAGTGLAIQELWAEKTRKETEPKTHEKPLG